MKAQILLHIIVVVLSLDAELGEGGGESSVQYWYSSSNSTLVGVVCELLRPDFGTAVYL